jgi:hypothetical protein
MTGKELDGLILDLKDLKDEKIINKVVKILAYRFSPRQIKLIGRLYQYNEDSAGVKEAMAALAAEGEKRKSFPPEGKFAFRFAKEKDLSQAIGEALIEMECSIDKFCAEYDIDPKSPLAQKNFFNHLAHGDKCILMENKHWLLEYLGKEEAVKLGDLIKNYLNAFTISEYSRSVNLKILERLGDPYESTDWEGYTRQEREKIAQWNFIYALKTHTLDYPKKYELLSVYYSEIRSCKATEDKTALIIDFGDLVIVDPKNKPHSYFCKKEFMDEYMIDTNPTARDFIIESREGRCIKLSYQGIEALYINEMLDIIMGKQPDLRQKVGISNIKSQKRF